MMQSLLRRKPRPIGVFCHNDIVAIGAMKAPSMRGLSIPDEIAFVGLTTCATQSIFISRLRPLINPRRARRNGRELALDLIARKIEKPKTIFLAPTLVVRESTIGLKAAAKQPAVAGRTSSREPQAKRRLPRR